MSAPGPANALGDVAGLSVGHAEDPAARSGVTVVLAAEGAAAAVDVRGGGPATRETDALGADRLVGAAHLVVLSGGSVFGLAAADGAARWASSAGVGFRLRGRGPALPIVPAAAIHDLGLPGRPGWTGPPDYAALGAEAAAAAEAGDDSRLGSLGAGRGAVAGRLKGGVGAASLILDEAGAGPAGGATVAALMVANPAGSAIGPDGRAFWAWPLEIGAEFGGVRPDRAADGGARAPLPMDSKFAIPPEASSRENTSIGVVGLDADLTSAECRRVAAMAQSGLARAVRPAHTPFDGDAVFVLATGRRPLGVAQEARPLAVAALGSAAADCVARALCRGVYAAETRPGEPPSYAALIA